jgi:transmembrane sensor
VAEYLAIAQLHGDMRAVAATQDATQEALRDLAASEPSVIPLRREQAPARTSAPAAKKPRSTPLKWAAAAAVALAASTALLLAWPGAEVTATRYAAVDDIREVTLDDDTRLQLAPGSIVDVRFEDRARRIELIQGDASFDIGKDLARPMTVTVGNHRIEDIGTVFDVSRRADDTQVTVVSGRVAISQAPSPWLERARHRLTGNEAPRMPIIELGGGDMARVSADGRLLEHGTTDVAAPAAWLPADIRFHDASVADVARRFNAYTSTPLTIDDPALAGKRISGVFHARDPEAFISYLGSLPNVAISRQANRIRFTAARGPKRL